MEYHETSFNVAETDYQLSDTHYEYKHFNTSIDCDIYLMNNPNISVSRLCCGGKGYAFIGRPKSVYKGVKLPTPTQGNCDICFLEDICLYSMCTKCVYPMCLTCLKQCSSKSCPFCRSTLQSF